MIVACVFITHFRAKAELLRRPDLKGNSFLIADRTRSGSPVVDRSPMARGVLPGMTLRQVMSIHTDLTILDADEPHYKVVFDRLLDSLEGVSDAGSKFTAYAARTARPMRAVKTPDNTRPFLAPMSIDILPVSSELKTALRRFGMRLIALARETGAWLVATNGVLYHASERYRLQHALIAIRHNSTIDQSLRHILTNDQCHLKSRAEMEAMLADCPEAVSNTVEIAERCGFDLSSDLGYTLPEPRRTGGIHASDVPAKTVLRGRRPQVRLDNRAGRAAACRGVPSDRAQRDGGLSAAAPRDSAAGAGDHGGARHGWT